MDLKTYFKENFIRLNREEPFTEKQKEKYSDNDRNFINYMQIQFKTTRENALKYFEIYKNDIITNAQKRKDFQKSIADMYEGLLMYQNAPDADFNRKSEDIAYNGNIEFKRNFIYKYKNAFGDLEIKKETKERFVLLDKKSRRYLDTVTGKELSRRARDKLVIELSLKESGKK